MNKQQPEALRLADAYEATRLRGHTEAAAELRRLHAENVLLHYTLTAYVGVSEALAVEQTENERLESQRDELLEALQSLVSDNHPECIPSKLWQKARAAIAKARQGYIVKGT